MRRQVYCLCRAFFGLGDAHAGFRLIGLQSRTYVLSYVAIGDVKRDDGESGLRVQPFFQFLSGKNHRIRQGQLVTFTRVTKACSHNLK